MATPQPSEPEAQIDVTAAEWLMIMVTGFTGVFLGPFALIPGALTLGLFAYRINPELMRSSKAGTWVRGLLPAPTPHTQASDAAPTHQPINATTPAGTRAAAPARTLAMIDLATLARSSTILLVGSRGSGKSTLLRAILSARSEAIMVYDPHAHPTAWPMATMLHNSEESISAGLTSAYKRLQARKHEMRTGTRIAGWPALTLAADEWGSIVSSVVLPKTIDRTPGEVSTELLKEGRKFGIGFVAGAHGKTNASLGCTGDQEAFIQSFDWIINLGGFTRKMLARDYADLLDQIPMGTNEQGSTFPLIVVCESPTTGELRLLDMRGLDTIVDSTPRPVAPVTPWAASKASADDGLLAGLLDMSQADTSSSHRENELQHSQQAFHASQREVADSPSVAVPHVTPADMASIIVQLQRDTKPSTIAKSLPGYNGRNYHEYKAKVEYITSLLDTQPGNPGAHHNDESPAAS